MADQIADPVQPDDGQGETGTTDTPYAEYLDRIPAEQRGTVEPIFKEWDANTTRKFQESAEFKRTWEPYSELGVNQVNPDEVRWLMQFRDALNNPQTIQEWYETYATQNGLTPTAPAAPAAPSADPGLDEFGFPDPNAQLEELLKQQLGPVQQQLQALDAWREQQESTVRLAEAERYVQGQVADLKAKHPDEFNEAAVERLVAQYIDTDPQHAVERAFADWQAIRSQIERETLQSKVNTPAAAEFGGTADGSPMEIKTLADASRIALEQLKLANRA